MSRSPLAAIGLLETTGYTPAIVALDAMTKAARVTVVQAELNDFLGVVIKVTGDLSSVQRAIETGHEVAHKMHGQPVSEVLQAPDAGIQDVLVAPTEFNPLIQQDVVHQPHPELQPIGDDSVTNSSAGFALGFIETQGFTAVFQAIDSACKAANVEVVGKEKLGGGYVTVIVKGDVAAVKAAVEHGQQEVEALGKLIAAHVIPRPSESVLRLLPAPVA